MYIASYRIGGREYSQCAVRLPFLVRGSQGRWREGLDQTVAAILADPSAAASIRFERREDRFLRTLILTGSSPAVVRRYLARLSPLISLVEGGVELAESRDRHDEWMQAPHWPAQCDGGEIHPAAGGSVVRPVQLGVDDLFACSFDEDLIVQINLIRAPDPLFWERLGRRTLLQIEGSVPKRLLDHQRLWFQSWLPEPWQAETVVLHPRSPQKIVSEAWERRTLREPDLRVFPEPEGTIDRMPDPFEISGGLHSCLGEPPHAEALGHLVGRDAVRAILGWQPSDLEARRFRNVFDEGAARDEFDRIETRLAALERRIDGMTSSARTITEVRRAVEIARRDAAFSLVKARSVLETVIGDVYRREIGGEKPLINMIDGVLEKKVVKSRPVQTYLHAIRVLGNFVVHPGSSVGHVEEVERMDAADATTALLMTLRIVEWYLLEYIPGSVPRSGGAGR
jgi:hypothetical protein